jgi:F-type H+-transporting ATPase subunit a
MQRSSPMSFIKSILVALTLLAAPQFLLAAEQTAVARKEGAESAAPHPEHGPQAAHEEHHGLPSAAVPLAQVGPFVITNSMLVTWIAAAALILFVRMATRKMALVPQGAQNLCESLVEGLHDFLEGILGPYLVKKTFWFFATVFIFILATNWLGLFPGVGTIGWGHYSQAGKFVIDEPLLRGGNADLNMTAAMAMLFFLLWTVWAIQAQGIGGVIKHIFGMQGDATGFMKAFLAFVFLVVGVLEVMSILFRPVSLSLRLYGNIFAGENILESMTTLVPWLGWLLPVPFYFLELLVGLVQALVFCLLTAVFTALICEHHEGAPGEAHIEKKGAHH